MESENMILRMFEDHNCELYSSLSNSSEYKDNSNRISTIYREIEEKYKNHNEILHSFEEYSSAVYSSNYLCEKLMYKHGVMDGIKLVVEGMTKIDMKSI